MNTIKSRIKKWWDSATGPHRSYRVRFIQYHLNGKRVKLTMEEAKRASEAFDRMGQEMDEAFKRAEESFKEVGEVFSKAQKRQQRKDEEE